MNDFMHFFLNAGHDRQVILKGLFKFFDAKSPKITMKILRYKLRFVTVINYYVYMIGIKYFLVFLIAAVVPVNGHLMSSGGGRKL